MAGAPNTMIGLTLPPVDVWSERVVMALGMNPGLFTGPGTNTYLIGTGPRRVLLDTGQGVPDYLPVLEQALARAGAEGIEQIVLTHAHPDHIGGLAQVRDRFGEVPVAKLPWPGVDDGWAGAGIGIEPLREGDRVRTAGATLRAIHTPGHAPDHLCFVLEEERAIFSGDNVLGVGTTVIPDDSGDLGDYLRSLERMLAESPAHIYPAHGPLVRDGAGKLREYLAHRADRERQILDALAAGPARVPEIVRRVYVDVPEVLHRAAAHSVTAHLRKLEREGRAGRRDGARPLEALWSRT